MINRCFECVHSTEVKHETYTEYVCNIINDIKNPMGEYGVTWFDGCPYFRMENFSLQLRPLPKNDE